MFITPHATDFSRNDQTGTKGISRRVVGRALSPEILPEDIGRIAMVEKVAEGVRAAMKVPVSKIRPTSTMCRPKRRS
ncbi:ring-opening amidohydrolase [Mesorhizobium sp. CC13]|uniref:ring-opening amidohydrolase n=1 Tax=Mesorhizobium sp. CC13 TaxID=3029194 RepID=UPI003263C666